MKGEDGSASDLEKRIGKEDRQFPEPKKWMHQSWTRSIEKAQIPELEKKIVNGDGTRGEEEEGGAFTGIRAGEQVQLEKVPASELEKKIEQMTAPELDLNDKIEEEGRHQSWRMKGRSVGIEPTEAD